MYVQVWERLAVNPQFQLPGAAMGKGRQGGTSPCELAGRDHRTRRQFWRNLEAERGRVEESTFPGKQGAVEEAEVGLGA